MKTYTNLYENAFSFKALLQAYKRARRGKRYRTVALTFSEQLESNILALRNSLYSGTYEQGHYHKFIVHDAKKRNIQAAPFRDRVVHQAVHVVLEPIFDRSFIFDSYACRKGKGTFAAILRFEQFAKSNTYVLTGDISKYFANIDHAILMQLLAKRIADKKMLRLCEIIIDSSHETQGKGIPIGNLTSQLFANIYLNELDQFVKQRLGVHAYVRYMDDFMLMSNNKAFLHDAKKQIEDFVRDTLALALHPKKSEVIPLCVGIEYLGYRIFPHYRKLKKVTVQRFIKRTKRAQEMVKVVAGGGGTLLESMQSWLVYAQKARSRGLLRSIATRMNLPISLFK
jgi:retron-type reverse transcriptase